MDQTWWAVAIAGLLVGFVVGLTGMGGGALMTPMMILLFNVNPLTAVSSDLVASMVMKPVGGAVHLRKGTVNKSLVQWLVIGSVPSAFLGVLVLRWIGANGGDRRDHQDLPRASPCSSQPARWSPRRCSTSARRNG